MVTIRRRGDTARSATTAVQRTSRRAEELLALPAANVEPKAARRTSRLSGWAGSHARYARANVSAAPSATTSAETEDAARGAAISGDASIARRPPTLSKHAATAIATRGERARRRTSHSGDDSSRPGPRISEELPRPSRGRW